MTELQDTSYQLRVTLQKIKVPFSSLDVTSMSLNL